ncbi:MAG: hypothetical protein KDG89_06900 [Geminicoccaceae bacterium]|nr:hypothetical protein [Geminicoccaceae bacterium]
MRGGFLVPAGAQAERVRVTGEVVDPWCAVGGAFAAGHPEAEWQRGRPLVEARIAKDGKLGDSASSRRNGRNRRGV